MCNGAAFLLSGQEKRGNTDMNLFFKNILTRRPAFTLLEIMVVLAILAVLVAVAVPNYRLTVEKAKVTECLATRVYAERAQQVFMSQNDNQMATTAKLVSGGYLDRFPRCVSGGALVWISSSPVKMACSLHDASAPLSDGPAAASAPEFFTGFTTLSGVKILTGDWKIKSDMLLTSSKGSSVNEVILSTGPFKDYATEVVATLYKGGIGVYYRATMGSGDKISGYSFQMDSTGKLQLWTVVNGNLITLLSSSSMPSGFPATGVAHTITVDAVGALSTVYIDGARVMQVTDSTFSQGTSGLSEWKGSAAVDSISINTP